MMGKLRTIGTISCSPKRNRNPVRRCKSNGNILSVVNFWQIVPGESRMGSSSAQGAMIWLSMDVIPCRCMFAYATTAKVRLLNIPVMSMDIVNLSYTQDSN